MGDVDVEIKKLREEVVRLNETLRDIENDLGRIVENLHKIANSIEWGA